MTALTFAIVGDSRHRVLLALQADSWPDKEAGILLAAARVRWACVWVCRSRKADCRSTGRSWHRRRCRCRLHAKHYRLVWRSVVFWLILLLLLTLASLLG